MKLLFVKSIRFPQSKKLCMNLMGPIMLEEERRKLTTFACHRGLFCYKRLPFGFANEAEICQKYIELSLEGLDGVRNISDDLIVHGSNQEEHVWRLHSVFERLYERGFTVNLSKCEFSQPSISYLGHVFSSKDVSADVDEAKAILEIERPTNTRSPRSFLGLVTYGAKFILNFSTLSEPFRQLLRKNVKFH